jgi:hypothetical protein
MLQSSICVVIRLKPTIYLVRKRLVAATYIYKKVKLFVLPNSKIDLVAGKSRCPFFKCLYQVRVITSSQFSGCWLILSVYILMSFDFPFVRLFGVRYFCYYPFGKYICSYCWTYSRYKYTWPICRCTLNNQQSTLWYHSCGMFVI